MTSSTINHQLAELALTHVDGGSFERFAQAFLGAIRGSDFVPVGGHADGGSDGFVERGLFEETRVDHFVQASIQVDYTGKVRQTAARLIEVGRVPKTITYITSQNIGNIDLAEEALSDELGVLIRIRDQKYITANINNSPATIQAFNTYLAPHLAYLNKIGGATTLTYVPELPVRALCVFLGQEIERRSGNAELLEAVTDSLILWALEDTDPDAGKLKGKDEILATVEAALPAAKKFIRGNIANRLEILSSKQGDAGRKIRFYKKEQKYCLPFETRELVKQENEEDELLKLSVSQVFRTRLANEIDSSDAITAIEQTIEVCHRTLQITFETQGLEMAHFVLGEDPDDYVSPTIADHIAKAAEELQIGGKLGQRVKALAAGVLRGTFYASSPEERLFLGKLSRTYILLFMLKNEPKIVEYFRGMASEFIIYVGSDIVIRALSEYYLSNDDQDMQYLQDTEGCWIISCH